MTATEEILAAIEKNKSSLQDIELMINSLNDVRASAHFTYLLVQGRTDPVPGAAFREHAKFTYTALESLSKQAISSEALLNELQALELSKLQGPSPLSIKSKQDEAEEGQQAAKINPQSSVGAESTLESTKRREYLNLSIDDTLRWFKRSARQSGLRVFAVRLGDQPSLPFSIVKVCIAGVLNAFIVMETSKKGRCLAISRLVVFGAGEENSIWEDSNHLVFRKITQTAVGAVDYYKAKEPRSLLGLVLEWIATYRTLFTAPCAGCHKHLLFDSQHFKHLPPTLYTYDKPKHAPFHPQCLA
ncbi:hypothetical protein KVV02_005010 [Mortierella alpina]|uniref:Mediator of RNA polymerase II transcription subunit 27 n=1 Tax=Mortierella alpina TaxID=64518 RepID=A0A9P8A0F7_MORAP|nr:hypothetical protein KVV02_005010 [Mortierella alpina]